MCIRDSLALYFALHTLFGTTTTHTLGPVSLEVPDLTSLDPVAVGIALVAAVLLLRLRWSVLRTLGVCAALGLVVGLVPALV